MMLFLDRAGELYKGGQLTVLAREDAEIDFWPQELEVLRRRADLQNAAARFHLLNLAIIDFVISVD